MVKENRSMKNRVTSSAAGPTPSAKPSILPTQGETDLTSLIASGRQLGYLTFDQVNAYLPDEAVDPEKIDALLVALEEQGIELVDTPPDPRAASPAAATAAPQPRRDEAITTPPSNAANDPIRMYLAQMAEIPLLTRREEISLAKRIEVTRKRFRRAILGCAYSLQATVDTLRKVHQGTLPFDRTIKVSLTERLTKEQIQSRMPHNLGTLDHLMGESRAEFRKLISTRPGRAAAVSAAAGQVAPPRGGAQPPHPAGAAPGEDPARHVVADGPAAGRPAGDESRHALVRRPGRHAEGTA